MEQGIAMDRLSRRRLADSTAGAAAGFAAGRVCRGAACLLLGLFLFSLPAQGHCASPRQLYFKAEACYQDLKDAPAKQKYRSYWKKCIDRFERVHEADPDGPWAAAGLYMSGRLYARMYTHSYSEKDVQAARAIYAQVIRDYPDSKYRERSRNALEQLPDVGAAARKAYFSAESDYQELKKHPEHQKYRSYWKNCIDQFAAIYRRYPDNPWAPAAMFMSARLYEELHSHSYNPSHRKKAAGIYQRLIERYPESQYRQKAKSRLKHTGDVIGEVIAGAPEPSEPASSPADKTGARQSDAPTSKVTGLRYWSNPDYTRVVIDASRETRFKNNLLKKDPSINKPYPRLYVDLANARLGEVEKKLPINDSLLRMARAGQHSKDTVRVVVDIKSFEEYDIFSLNNPFRIVIDVRGESGNKPASSQPRGGDSIIRPLGLGVNRIVIDPGHGGKDYGAPGYLRGVHEKQVALSLSKKLAGRLRKELGCEVLLTRKTDTYLTLEERTAIANTEKADLFISVHANAARDHRAFGIETYFLNLTADESAISVAARENATSKKNISELDSILQDLLSNAKINESSRLATYVQNSLVDYLKPRYSRINDKGVKQAPFYVLLGAQMPSILIEASFISNPRECRRLTDPEYQSALSEAILKGISRYIEDIQPKAHFYQQPAADTDKG